MTMAPKVLIVDDNPKNVKLLEAYLVTTGVRTEAAYDGEEALEKIVAAPPDLILLDIMMPKIDGYEVCRRVKDDASTRIIPIIMVTALDQMEDKVKGIDAGADDFLSKPVNRLELLARTKSLIRTKQLNSQVINLQRTLGSLFEITTFTKRFSDRKVLLTEFTKRAADFTGADSVLISFRHDGEYITEATYPHRDSPIDDYQRDALNWLHAEMETRKDIQVVTSSNLPEDEMRLLGVRSGYVGVPLMSLSGEQFGAIHAFNVNENLQDVAVRFLLMIAQRLAHELEMKAYNKRLEEEVALRTAELQKAMNELKLANADLHIAQVETIFRLAKAAEHRDDDTAGHIHRLSIYTTLISEHLGKDETYCKQMKLASQMHDIGKIAIPDAILLKKGRFTPKEFELMKEHTLIGARILSGSSTGMLSMSEQIALSHHEKYDGSGYPNQLKKYEIPLEARIVAVADVFDALTTARVYKPAYSVEKTLDMMKSERERHFDPEVLDAFFHILDDILEVKGQYVFKKPISTRNEI